PAAGGGLYWPGPDDQRDFRRGFDSNEMQRNKIITEIWGDLLTVLEKRPSKEVSARILAVLEKSAVADITEFGRAVHAEMEALLSCARNGISPRDGTLYSTTFPCHNCAKHIAAAGIARVVFVEPY